MVFDPTLPTDTTKIRDLGTVIRPNWVAIQDADSTFLPQAINFNDRTVAGVPVDPTAIANAYILYCKTDTSGNSELFGINESSQILQFTKGEPTLLVTQSSIFLVGGMILKTGKSSFSGTGSSVSVTFTTAFPTSCFGVIITLLGDNRSSSVDNTISTTGFSAERDTTGSPLNNGPFNWIAWGN